MGCKKIMNSDKNQDDLPVMCSKCNIVFKSDFDHIRHYNDKHTSDKNVKRQFSYAEIYMMIKTGHVIR
jgi:uncharacterized C2H2 Zn-finger protein